MGLRQDATDANTPENEVNKVAPTSLTVMHVDDAFGFELLKTHCVEILGQNVR